MLILYLGLNSYSRRCRLTWKIKMLQTVRNSFQAIKENLDIVEGREKKQSKQTNE